MCSHLETDEAIYRSTRNRLTARLAGVKGIERRVEKLREDGRELERRALLQATLPPLLGSPLPPQSLPLPPSPPLPLFTLPSSFPHLLISASPNLVSHHLTSHIDTSTFLASSHGFFTSPLHVARPNFPISSSPIPLSMLSNPVSPLFESHSSPTTTFV